MSFWEANRGLVTGAILALLLAAIMHFLVAGARRSQARDLERQAAELQAQIDKLDRGAPAPDIAAPEALKAIKAERAELDKVLKRTGGLLLTLPPEYVLPKNAPDKQLIFERQLSELRARCVEGRYPKYDQSKPQSCPLGFTQEIQKEEVELLLQRLAAARRLMAAADAANLARVLSISHGKAATLGSPGVSKMHLRLLPLNLRGVADEKSLVTFIQEISREGSFLGLESLEVEVTDPKAKTFNIKAGLLALVAMEGPAKAGGPGGPGQSGPTPPSIGRY
jgi:hypothetical protein